MRFRTHPLRSPCRSSWADRRRAEGLLAKLRSLENVVDYHIFQGTPRTALNPSVRLLHACAKGTFQIAHSRSSCALGGFSYVQFGTSLLHMPSALGYDFCLWRTAAGIPMPGAVLRARLAWGCAPIVRASRVRVPREARDAVSLAGSRAHSRPSPFGSGASGFGGVAGFGLLLRGSAACAGGLRPPRGNAAALRAAGRKRGPLARALLQPVRSQRDGGFVTFGVGATGTVSGATRVRASCGLGPRPPCWRQCERGAAHEAQHHGRSERHRT